MPTYRALRQCVSVAPQISQSSVPLWHAFPSPTAVRPSWPAPPSSSVHERTQLTGDDGSAGVPEISPVAWSSVSPPPVSAVKFGVIVKTVPSAAARTPFGAIAAPHVYVGAGSW